MNISDDWLNTETIKRPPTLVIVPSKNKTYKYFADIKYADFTGIQDISSTYPKAECYIVPPYKPLMYVALRSFKEITDVYAIRGTTNIFSYFSIFLFIFRGERNKKVLQKIQ